MEHVKIMAKNISSQEKRATKYNAKQVSQFKVVRELRVKLS